MLKCGPCKNLTWDMCAYAGVPVDISSAWLRNIVCYYALFSTQVVVIEAISMVDSVKHIPVFGYLDLI